MLSFGKEGWRWKMYIAPSPLTPRRNKRRKTDADRLRSEMIGAIFMPIWTNDKRD